MAGLDHQHIVQYVGSHRTESILYIVMEFAEGGSLLHVQKKFESHFPEHLVSQYLYQVLLGLEYLHSQAIIHRDIKAANILLNNNVAKLADFGISIKFDDAKRADQNLEFSAYWSAPEVISQEPCSELCDIWSLGITAIELFEGQPPYFDLPPIPAAFRIVQNDIPPLPEKASPEFRDFIECCLRKDVRFRKNSTQQLQHRFNQKYRPVHSDSESSEGDAGNFRTGPSFDFDALDRLLEDPADVEREMEVERQNKVFETVGNYLARLPGVEDDPEETDRLCTYLENEFQKEPWLKGRLATSHEIVSLVDILTSRDERLLNACFPFIMEAGKEYRKLHKTLCILGVLPYLFSYVLETDFSATLQLRALGFLHLFCKPL
jgi:serine/threonine protein kinase